MYKVTKSFIYRAKLYTVGQELSDKKFQRMLRDKVAAKRGVLEMVVPQKPPEPVPVPVPVLEPVLESEPVLEEKPVKKAAPAKRPGRPKKQPQE